MKQPTDTTEETSTEAQAESAEAPTQSTEAQAPARRTRRLPDAHGLAYPGVVLHAVGLEMPDGLPEAQADRILEDIGKAHLSLGWAVADALVFGERFGHDSKRYARASELTGLSVETLRTYAWVARHVPISIRIDTLSISHHRQVANKPPDVQSRYLLQAAGEGLSVAALALRIEADSRPAHATLEEASRVLPSGSPVLPSGPALEEVEEAQEAESVLDIERVTEDDPGGVVFGSRSGSQHFDYSQPNRKDPLKGHRAGVQSHGAGVPALAPGAPTLLPVRPCDVTQKPSEATKEPTVKLGPIPASTPRPKFVPNATDEIAEGVLRLGPVWFYRFEIIVNGKLTFVNVMVSPHDTGNGLRWQATTDNGRGDVNTIPRVPLFTPHASREELEARLLAHFGKEATPPGKEATQTGKEARL